MIINNNDNDNDNEIHLFKPNFICSMDNKYCRKVPNTVKTILMQFFTTIMEFEFVAMSITMVQN